MDGDSGIMNVDTEAASALRMGAHEFLVVTTASAGGCEGQLLAWFDFTLDGRVSITEPNRR